MTTPTPPRDRVLPIRFTAPARGLLADLSHGLPLRLVFTYDPRSPYEVVIGIQDWTGGDGDPIYWCVSRETLVLAALYDIAAGDGDFRAQQIQPEYVVPGVGPSLRLRFCSDHVSVPKEERGPFHVDVAIHDIERGLHRALRAVPLGGESRHMDMDYQISQLLGHTTGGH